ncbi:MAG TPA: ribosome-associated translation inhibitor RaiA [Vicinamibacterales bacterium]|nr:ribosome-associated translation inhibitor RaiA [Vicinamibacterales bacterium]
MRLDITGRHVDIGTPLRQIIDKRIAKLERLLNDNAISGQVILTKEKYRHRAEIVIHARGDHILRGQGEGTAWPISLRDAAAKIEQQAQTLKGKWGERKRKGAGARAIESAGRAPDGSGAGLRVIRARRYAVKPMSVEDAALRVAAGDEAFVVFRNADTDAVSILYRRNDGNYGLIEPD